MQLAVGESKRMGRVLVEMRESVVPLGNVESEDAKADSANDLLLERTLLLVGDRVATLACQQIVLVLVELSLHLATEHIYD